MPWMEPSPGRTDKLAASPQLFESDFLNFFSRVHPSIPAIVFVPVVVATEWLGADLRPEMVLTAAELQWPEEALGKLLHDRTPAPWRIAARDQRRRADRHERERAPRPLEPQRTV